ncbi:MAG: hypothetical protein IKV43_04635 [Clostridia bacterium]|nr:hypothetical protein [Clostridia bacterium]
MKSFTDDIDYKGQYALYRKLPVIVAAISAGTIALSAVVTFFILAASELVGAALIVLLCGAVVTAIIFFVEMFLITLTISPTIVQTDALLEISKKLDGGSTTTKHTTRTTTTKTVPKWRCPTCGTTNDLSTTTCAHCFHKRPATTASTGTATKWCCPSCGSTNEMSETVCPTCSYKKS